MPRQSYTDFFNRLLAHSNITIELNVEALNIVRIRNDKTIMEGREVTYPVIFTGALDELFDQRFGQLPYRSLRFKWIHEDIDSKQKMPVVAYPQAPDFIRIIEFKKLPVQMVRGTTYEVEYSLPYKAGEKNEPYYPLLTDESQKLYKKYAELASRIANLYVCGRLGAFKYYNMDQALEAALKTVNEILQNSHS
jgi:UDP-galactopyranose mutase